MSVVDTMQPMKAYGGKEVQLHVFLTLALKRGRGGEWVSFSPPGKEALVSNTSGAEWVLSSCMCNNTDLDVRILMHCDNERSRNNKFL